MEKLTFVSVKKLLGVYDHSFAFEADDNVAILYGPNGVGKTHVLELVCYALQGDWNQLQSMPFDEATLKFADETQIRLSFEVPGHESDISNRLGRTGRRARNDEPQLKVTHSCGSRTTSYFPLTMDIEQFPMSLVRSALRDLGIQSAENERPNTYSMRAAIGELSASDEKRVRIKISSLLSDDNEVLDNNAYQLEETFFNSSNATLIETQRLLGQRDPDDRRRTNSTPRLTAIQEVSQSIQQLMDAALAVNSRKSQQLDRTFPERILNSSGGDIPSEEWIRDTHTTQLAVRERLSEYHLATDASDRVELPERDLQDWERYFLGQYLIDSNQKLESFEDLLLKLDLFISTINLRFTNKNIYFNSERSLGLINSTGKVLKVSDLSSGEQHEIILLKYLLFDATPGSIVLIDEPEISLHVAWQKEFLRDLQKVSEISELRFIIATHSPQIINNSWNLTKALGSFAE